MKKNLHEVLEIFAVFRKTSSRNKLIMFWFWSNIETWQPFDVCARINFRIIPQTHKSMCMLVRRIQRVIAGCPSGCLFNNDSKGHSWTMRSGLF